ncbi:unnamed protein product [Cochlearia groenlandica]
MAASSSCCSVTGGGRRSTRVLRRISKEQFKREMSYHKRRRILLLRFFSKINHSSLFSHYQKNHNKATDKQQQQHQTTTLIKTNTKEEVSMRVIEDEQVAFDAPSLAETKTEEKEYDCDSADELCYLKDAVETMLSRGLTDHQKKLQVDNIVKLGAGKRRELSCEWKALCGEEAKLIMNKFKLAAKIANAIDDKF